MRRALVTEWPALSRFGLHPWDLPRLTRSELAVYLAAIQKE